MPENTSQLQKAIQHLNEGDHATAEQLCNQLIEDGSSDPEVYCLKGSILGQQNRLAEAITQFETALSLDNDHMRSVTSLGHCYIALGTPIKAESLYYESLRSNPKNAELRFQLGNLLAQRAAYAEAKIQFELLVRDNATMPMAYNNLGRVQAALGELEDAESSYQQAIALNPNLDTAYNNLGSVLVQLNRPGEAIASFEQAVSVNNDFAEAKYNLADAYYQMAQPDKATIWFEAAAIRDWRARVLCCSYKSDLTDQIDAQLSACMQEPNQSPQVAAISTHWSKRQGTTDNYKFCPQALKHVLHESMPELLPGHLLNDQLVHLIQTLDVDSRIQTRIHNGTQSSGNLLYREETPIQHLAAAIRQACQRYRTRFAESDSTLIKNFPTNIEFENSWFVRLQQDGFLDPHIHETGWISGVVYLKLPHRGESNEGCLELGQHGDDYPGFKPDLFESMVVPIEAGDIVIFPSSVFHRTIPFRSDMERICIAFDVKSDTERV